MDNFVRAKLLNELDISLYIIIDEKQKIDNLCSIIKKSEYESMVDLIVYKYDNIDGDYWYLKINSKEATKDGLIEQIKLREKFEKVVVCGSGNTDIKAIENADFSICLDNAPEYIKEKVNLVIDSNPGTVLKIFDKIYHCKNFDKMVMKINKKYNKK